MLSDLASSLTFLVPLWFAITSFLFLLLCKVIFSGFLQLKSYFVPGQDNSVLTELLKGCSQSLNRAKCCILTKLPLSLFSDKNFSHRTYFGVKDKIRLLLTGYSVAMVACRVCQIHQGFT